MSKLTNDEMNINYRWRRNLIGAFVAVILGAIGSGLWELFLKDAFDFIGRNMLKAWSVFFSAERIYKKIGRGHFDYFGLLPFVIACSILIVGPWILTYRLSISIKKIKQMVGGEEETIDRDRLFKQANFIIRWRKLLIAIMIVTSAFSVLTYSSLVYEASYTNKAITWIEQSIDILAPHIGTDNVVKLRAAYRSVENASEFYALEDNIKNIAEAKKVTVPRFDSIR